MKNDTAKMVSSALFLAMAQVLPFLTGQVPQIGSMLCPMHFPVIICGFICGPGWGAAVGAAAPILRHFSFGMPPIYPTGLSMAAELAVYGAVSGLCFKRFKAVMNQNRAIYLSLIAAMLSGRLVWGAVRYAMLGLGGTAFSMEAFVSGALLTAWPGIILQLIIIPIVVKALRSVL